MAKPQGKMGGGDRGIGNEILPAPVPYPSVAIFITFHYTYY